MRYHRVKPEYDGKRRNASRPNSDVLIANELYTDAEMKIFGISHEAVELIKIRKSDTYWSFGARFGKEGAKHVRS